MLGLKKLLGRKKEPEDRGDVWFFGHATLKSGPGHATFDLLRKAGSKEVRMMPPECIELISDEQRACIDRFLEEKGYRFVA